MPRTLPERAGDAKRVGTVVQNHACDVAGPVMERDRERRETVERYHRLKDLEEDFVFAQQARRPARSGSGS